MTYGRPTMTAHVPDLPLPVHAELDEPREFQLEGVGQEEPSKMCFYVEYIRQCRILGQILSNVYQPSAGGGFNLSSLSGDAHKMHGMDAILDLDAKLSRYEASVTPIMSWKSPCDLSGLAEDRRLVIKTQRTVLRGR